MVAFEVDGVHFNYRVAGVALHDGHVMLQQAEGSGFWFLPGGRCEAGESSGGTLAREMIEECGESVTVGRLVWVAENFFVEAGIPCHELGLYYLMEFAHGSPMLDLRRCFSALDGPQPCTFRWFPLESLTGGLRVYPAFLCRGLLEIPEHITHVVHRDSTWRQEVAAPHAVIEVHPPVETLMIRAPSVEDQAYPDGTEP